jgi:hypothetical protein
MLGGYPPPAAPSNLAAAAASSSQIDLTWDDNSTNETGFKIERSADGSTGWAEIGTNSAGDTTYSDTGLTASTTYYYRVRAYSAYGYSAYTSVANATTSANGIADTFTGTNGTSLDGRNLSSGGVAWDAIRGNAEIQSNACAFSDLTGVGGNLIVADASLANGTVQCDVYFGGKTRTGGGAYTPVGFAGLAFRVKSTDGSGIEFYLNGADQKVEAFTNDGANGRTALGEVAFTFATETTYVLKVVLNGTSIKCYVDNVLKLDLTSSFNQAEDKHGPWTWSTATDTSMPGDEVYGDDTHRWDNFEVTA